MIEQTTLQTSELLYLFLKRQDFQDVDDETDPLFPLFEKKVFSYRVYRGIKYIHISNIIFDAQIIWGDILPFAIHFEKCVFNKEVSLNYINNTIILSKCIFNDYLIIARNNAEDGSINLSNSEFNNTINFLESNLKELHIYNCHFLRRCEFNTLKIESFFSIMNGTFDDEVGIYKCTFEKEFMIHEGASFNQFSIYSNIFNTNVLMYNISISSVLKILQNEFKKDTQWTIRNSKIQHLDIYSLPPKILISEIDIIKVMLMDVIVKDKETVSIINGDIHNIYIHSLTNYGFMTFNNIKSMNDSKMTPELIIANTNLGKCDFISCDFNNFKITIDSSKLLDMFYTNTKFPNEFHSKKTTDKEQEIQLRETYGQMKAISEKIGNKIKALDFQAKEMDSYYKSIHKSPDKMLLWFMKYSNNFRQSWGRGVVFTLLIGIIPYILFILSADKDLHWGNYGFSSTMKMFFKYVFNYVQFINPTHKTEFLGEINNPIAYLFDFIGRIFIGYGIFQTIQAFRKFGKE